MRRIAPILGYLGLITLSALGATVLAAVVTPRHWPTAYAWLIKATLVMSFVIAITAFYLRRAGLTWSDFGARRDTLIAHCGLGMSLGLVLGLAWTAVVYAIAPFSAHWNADIVPAHWFAASLGTVAMGIAEEVGYRSFALRGLRLQSGYWTAVFLPTTLFAVSHLAGGVPWQAAVLVVGSASVLFAIVMLEMRSLPLVIALHVATNLVQDNLLRSARDSSLFDLAEGSGPTPTDQFTIWVGLATVNVLAAIATLAWARRRR